MRVVINDNIGESFRVLEHDELPEDQAYERLSFEEWLGLGIDAADVITPEQEYEAEAQL